jgi:geranylgeranyl pyrophosphate synthase
MKEELMINADASFHIAEQRAAQYFKLLKAQVLQRGYVSTLMKDLQEWKTNHIYERSFLSIFSSPKGKAIPKGYHNYLRWLDYTGKLDNYLDRSFSYIFMRDLGKALDEPETQNRVRRVIDFVKSQLIQPSGTESGIKIDFFSMEGLYRKAQEDGIESTMIWVINKLKTVSANIPEGMDAEHAKRKLIKIIAGVFMHATEEMEDDISSLDRSRKLDEAIRLGYSYGLTYPFIDDLLDAKILTEKEQNQYSNIIRTSILTESVPELGEWDGANKELIQFVHSELRDAFDYIKEHLRPEIRTSFFEQAYVFFQSQEVDRNKDLSNPNYTNEELFIPVILKSSFSRLIARSVISAPLDEGFDNRTFFYGIYNQLADDFTDMFDDYKDEAVTPYTYYLKYHATRPDLINPFELYWTVISNLIHNVYQSDSNTREVILGRAINGLKRMKERLGSEKYNEIMELFFSESQEFTGVVQKLVRKADDVDFYDKLLRDHIISILKNNKKEQEEFADTVKSVREQINSCLKIPKDKNDSLLEEPIIEAANYSLKGDGKRLRPIITWVMGVHEYGLNKEVIVPLLKSLEYMHTASLIYDDLPSQDNAAIRRGRPTLHQVYNTAIAELTGLFLTQKAIFEQASLEQFDAKAVLNLIQYSTQIAADMCKGQAMDLDSKGKRLSLEQLESMSFYKTGIAFEASLIMPAILAQAKESEMEALRKFAYHAGIAFQIKDDLLDVEGMPDLLGKPIGKDAENNNSTFVSVLGLEEAKKAMWEHYCLAMEVLQTVPLKTTFLRHLLNYIVHRDH